jgi:hypothetical protein
MLSILDVWDIDEEYFTQVVKENPSLRGMILGYIAEKKLKDLFENSGKTEKHRKDDDHDRTKKGDLTLFYKGEEITIEVKSLQTNSIFVEDVDGQWIQLIEKKEVGRKPSPGLGKSGKPRLGAKIHKYIPNPKIEEWSQEQRLEANYKGAFQCDASDKREVTLDNGQKVKTTLLKVGEFDVIAAGIFSFRNKWEFAFALNEDLPKSTAYGELSSHLIASLVNISLPLQEPFSKDPFVIFDRLIEKRQNNG